jgi:hypothetical protein
LAYELLVGPIPDGLDLDHRHTCPKHCVNPAHLRPATRKQNKENLVGAYRNSKSGVRGVCWDRYGWRADIGHLGKTIYLGHFSTVEEATEVARLKRLELFTHNDVDRRAV